MSSRQFAGDINNEVTSRTIRSRFQGANIPGRIASSGEKDLQVKRKGHINNKTVNAHTSKLCSYYLFVSVNTSYLLSAN